MTTDPFDTIGSPDLREVPKSDLARLSRELRAFLIQLVDVGIARSSSEPVAA